MARYKVLARSYLNDTIADEGSEVEYAGVPGSALDPIDDEAKKAKAKSKHPKGGPFNPDRVFAPPPMPTVIGTKPPAPAADPGI